MKRPLEGLSDALREVPDVSTTAASWQGLVGEAWGLVEPCLKRTKELAQGWPCGARGGGSWGCTRALVEHARNDIEAVCEEGSCPTVRVSRDDAIRRTLDLVQLAERIAPGFHLDPSTPSSRLAGVDESGVLLGVLRVDEPVAVVLTLAHRLPGLLSAGRAAQGAAGTARALVLAPLERGVSAEDARLLASSGVEAEALHDLVNLREGAVVVDLLAFVRRHDAPGVDPSPWFGDRWDLVLDPAQHRAWLGSGVALDFSRHAVLERLLVALAQKADGWVGRLDLAAVVYGPDGNPDLIPKRKSDLQGFLNAHGAGLTIGSLDSTDETDGSYRLPIPRARIELWSPLPPLASGGDDSQRNAGGTRKPASKGRKRPKRTT